MLTGSEPGEWQWDQEAYDFLIAILSRGLFRVSGGRTAYLVAPSGAGKGTLVDTCLLAFGSCAVKLRAREFVTSPFEAAAMDGKSLVIFDEDINAGLISKLNAYTDGAIRTERKFMDAINLHFGGLPMIADTKLPSMYRHDGAERRSAIFENAHTIERGVGVDDGGKLKLEIVAASAKPLLLQCLSHAKRGINDHSQPPESVLKSTRREWLNSDDVSTWISEHIEQEEGGELRFSEVRKRIEADLKLSNHTRNVLRIERAFTALGFTIKGAKKGRRICGAGGGDLFETL